MCRLPAALLLLPLLAACGSAGDSGGVRGEDQSPAPTASAISTPSSTVPAELTAEEVERLQPPSPVAVKAERVDGAVVLSWRPAPRSRAAHAYSDTVVGYLVYRRAAGEVELTLVARVDAARWTDATPPPGPVSYAVADVREDGSESARSDAVAVRP